MTTSGTRLVLGVDGGNTKSVRERHPAVERVPPRFAPAVGALLMALEPAPGSGVLERVEASVPGPELYESLSP